AEPVSSMGGEIESRPGDPRVQVCGAAPATRSFLPRLERVDDLTRPGGPLDTGELHPFHVADDSDPHRRILTRPAPGTFQDVTDDIAAVRTLLRRAPGGDPRFPRPPPRTRSRRRRVPGDLSACPPRVPEAPARRAPPRVGVHDRKPDRDRRAPPPARRRRATRARVARWTTGVRGARAPCGRPPSD